MKRKGYTRVPNALITDTRLSVGARLLYCYIASKPPGWKFSLERIPSELGLTKDLIFKLLRELEQLGVLHRVRLRDERGRLGGSTYDLSKYDETKFGKTKLGETKFGKMTPLNNTYNSNTDLNKTECESGDKSPAHTQDDIKKFFLSKAKEAQSTVGASDDTMIKFASYWMQRTEGGRMLWQTKRTFDFAARLKIWVKNEIRPN